MLLLLATGCGQPRTNDALLIKAYELGEAYEWNAARGYAKRYLVDHPYSASGHLLYGKGFLRVGEPNLAIAKGELNTALALFQRSPDLGALREKWTQEAFLGLIHHELATVYLRRIHTLSTSGVGMAIIERDLEEARRHVDLGLIADPENESLKMMRETLAEMMGQGRAIADRKQVVRTAPRPVRLARTN